MAIRAKRRRAHTQQWLKETGVRVLFDRRLASIRKQAGRIVSLRTTSGDVFEAPVFIDSSYEGDLMKAAGVSYAVGRDSLSLYNESLAGRQDFLPGSHQFRAAVPALGADGKLLPYVLAQETLEPTGTGGRKFQSYCFRICLTRNPANRLPLPRPEGYDAARFELARTYLKVLGNSAKLADFMGISLLPNDKTDINSGGAVSTNLPGANWDYPEASYERRREIWQEHLSWAQGLLYFLGNDPDVPPALRAEMNQWGLAKDEFPDTNHFPWQLYIREDAACSASSSLTRQSQENRHKDDSIGMGGYNIDIREVRGWPRRVSLSRPCARVFMEGYLSMPVEPYDIHIVRCSRNGRVLQPAGDCLHLRLEHRVRLLPNGTAVYDRRACGGCGGRDGGEGRCGSASHRRAPPAGKAAGPEADRSPGPVDAPKQSCKSCSRSV